MNVNVIMEIVKLSINNYKILYKGIIQMQKSQSIVQYMRHGPPARDGIPPLHSDGEALPKIACLSCVTSDDGDTPVWRTKSSPK